MPAQRGRITKGRYRPYGNSRRVNWGAVGGAIAGNLANRAINYATQNFVNRAMAPRKSGVTTQHDVVNQYRKKSMPKRMKRRWRKFTKKVTAAVDRHLGTRSIVRNFLMNVTIPAGQDQIYRDFGLYTLGSNWLARTGTIVDLFRDIEQIGFALGIPDPNAIAGSGPSNLRKMEFRSAVLDFTFKNLSSQNGLEVDVYFLIPKKSVRQSGNNDLFTIMDNGWNSATTPTAGTNLSSTTRGVTPWQSTALCRRFTITNKRKYFVPPGNTFTYQYRDPKNYTVDTNRFANGGLSYYGLPHMCRMVLICAKRIAGESTAGAHEFAIGITRTYTMKRWDDQDEDMFY